MGIENIWNNVREYIDHLISHAIMILATTVVLWGTLYITNFLFFSKRPKIIEYMENASYIGLMVIFLFYLSSSVYIIFKKEYERIKR